MKCIISVILIDPPLKQGHVRYTTEPLINNEEDNVFDSVEKRRETTLYNNQFLKLKTFITNSYIFD